MAFQAHLVMTIRERGITQATRAAWEVTDRLRNEGHEAYVVAVNKIGSTSNATGRNERENRRRGRSSPHHPRAEGVEHNRTPAE